MKHVLAPTREDLEDREGEWIIVATGTVIDPVFAPTGEDPESKSVIEDDSVIVAVDPFNPSLHIKKTKGEVLKGYHNVFEGRFSKSYRFLFLIEEAVKLIRYQKGV